MVKVPSIEFASIIALGKRSAGLIFTVVIRLNRSSV